jgi:hypothetical protein
MPKPDRYRACANLLLDGIEDAFGLLKPPDREKTIQAAMNILALYFPPEKK